MFVNRTMDDNVDWIVEQQRYEFEEAGRAARDELRCEVGSLRQHLRHAELRESILNQSLEQHYSVQSDLKSQLFDAELQNFNLREEIATCRDGWLYQQETLYRQLQDVKNDTSDLKGRSIISEPYEDESSWIEEQRLLYHQLQSKTAHLSAAPVVPNEAPASHGIPDEPPPPYEQQWCPATPMINDTEHSVSCQLPDYRCLRPGPRVRFADPVEIISNSWPTPSPKRKKHLKREVVGLCRRKSNRTAV